VKEKRLWQRYIYLWINYALFEELEAEDGEKCREVYTQCLRIIPHGKFSFSKIWIMYANFELRQQNLDAARAVFGNAMGRAPKPSIFEAYISTEQLLGNMDRCRVIYEKYLQFDPSNVEAWVKFTELEHSLGELERSRAIFELAAKQPILDMPEMLWKAYIDFEISEEEYDKVRGPGLIVRERRWGREGFASGPACRRRQWAFVTRHSCVAAGGGGRPADCRFTGAGALRAAAGAHQARQSLHLLGSVRVGRRRGRASSQGLPGCQHALQGCGRRAQGGTHFLVPSMQLPRARVWGGQA
jgi:hypothetical protein